MIFLAGFLLGFVAGMAFLVCCVIWDLREEMRKK